MGSSFLVRAEEPLFDLEAPLEITQNNMEKRFGKKKKINEANSKS